MSVHVASVLRVMENSTMLAHGNDTESLDRFIQAQQPDDMKFVSSLTLFRQAAPGEPLFAHALLRFTQGHDDERTLALLCQSPAPAVT